MKITELRTLASLVDRAAPRIGSHGDNQSSTSQGVIYESRNKDRSSDDEGETQYFNDQTPYTLSLGKFTGRRRRNRSIVDINEQINLVNLLAVELKQLSNSEAAASSNAERQPSGPADTTRSRQIISKLADFLQSTEVNSSAETRSNDSGETALQDQPTELLLNGVRSKLLMALHQMMHERASGFNWAETVEVRDEAQAVAHELKQQLPIYREEAIYGSANQDPQLVYELLRS